MRPRWPRRPLRRAFGVDSHDARAFPRAALWTRVVRLGLAATAVTLVILAAWSSRNLETGERGLLRTGETGVVVIDLSLSIEGEDYNVVRRALRQLIAENATIGLIVFSDSAYELLPPGTPASQLRPLLRLLVPPRLGPPVNPWTQTFRAGTQISTAIELAKDMLERDHVVDGSVLLVSDLETAPDDVPALASSIQSLRQDGIGLQVVPLGPSTDARILFGDAIEEGVFEASASSGEEAAARVSETTVTYPVMLLILSALFFVALAGHERYAGRLALTGGIRRQA
jgi:von Willebrand factor type A domain